MQPQLRAEPDDIAIPIQIYYALAIISAAREQRAEGPQRRPRITGVAARDSERRSDSRLEARGSKSISSVMAVTPGEAPAAAESPQLNHHLAIIVPSSSLAPKSRAYRMARLATDASVKHRRISIYAEIIEINAPPNPGQRPDSIYPPECRAGIDRRTE